MEKIKNFFNKTKETKAEIQKNIRFKTGNVTPENSTLEEWEEYKQYLADKEASDKKDIDDFSQTVRDIKEENEKYFKDNEAA